jgi:hypothetical protein
MTATRRTYDPLFKEKAIKGDLIKVEKELGISSHFMYLLLHHSQLPNAQA